MASIRGPSEENARHGRPFSRRTGTVVGDGERVSGVYRRSVMLASGRFAMLDDGKGFSLVPWKPVLGQRLGQSVAATVRGGGMYWEIGQQRMPSVG